MLWTVMTLAGAVAGRGAEWVPGFSLFDEALTEYKRRDASGPMAALARRLAGGQTVLEHNPQFGYLRAVLRELDIPESSQVLVFSKTSARKNEVSPKTPRALYYNDHFSVAFYPGSSELEIAAVDANLGVAFYRLEGGEAARPQLIRDDRCLECHLSTRTFGVPGLMLRSFLTGADGDVDPLNGKPMVTHRTPIEDRWGGYYVTGTHGSQAHLGNLFGGPAAGTAAARGTTNSNVTSLAPFLDVSRYPAPGSDIVSLLVLDHQACMLNLLIRLRFEAELSATAGKGTKAIDRTTDAVLRYLLCVDEVPYQSPVKGTSDFAQWFASRGPVDGKGRSLRQLDLRTRLLKYPCSFMIYSEAFDQLPEMARRHLYRRLWQVLNGEDASPEFQRIPAETRQAIREILNATKKDLPVYWRL